MNSGTPLLDALNAYTGITRMHMPGHKGRGMDYLSPSIDLTELPETGDLYRDLGSTPIRRAEALWADIFNARACLFLTGGASQGIAAALAAMTAPGDTILLDRCAHTSFTHAMALLDLRPVYLPRNIDDGLPQAVDAPALDKALCHTPSIKTVCITSQTYYGTCSDIPRLAEICHCHGALLFADAAHGAHFPFAGLGHPAAGADLYVCSAHKTLPALGQGALLFTGGAVSAEHLRAMTALFGTGSPSYLIMASLDAARHWLLSQGSGKYRQISTTISDIRCKYDILCQTDDPFRLVFKAGKWGYGGYELASLWHKRHNIRPEMADGGHVVMIASPHDSDSDYAAIDAALADTPRLAPRIVSDDIHTAPPARFLTPREAFFAKTAVLPLVQADGMAAARDITLYPPGIPLCAAGEVIDAMALARAGVTGPVVVAASGGSGVFL